MESCLYFEETSEWNDDLLGLRVLSDMKEKSSYFNGHLNRQPDAK